MLQLFGSSFLLHVAGSHILHLYSPNPWQRAQWTCRQWLVPVRGGGRRHQDLGLPGVACSVIQLCTLARACKEAYGVVFVQAVGFTKTWDYKIMLVLCNFMSKYKSLR